MLLLTVVIAAVAITAWQVVHRSSLLVRRWSASSFPRRGAGSLSMRDSGSTGHSDEEVVVLLHGLGATGDYFGAFYDGLSRQRRVLIFDLLGFGRSLDEERNDFGVDDHVAALDEALVTLGLGQSTIILAAHSMSSAIALTWAGRHPDRVGHVYLWGAPVYRGESAAQAVRQEYGLMSRLFVLDTKWAERACRLNCINRDVSGAVMAALAPRWPTKVSSDVSRHTWPAYHSSLRSLVLDFDWTAVLPAQVPVTFFHGTDDPIGDQAFVAELAGDAEVVEVASADHHIALQHPELLFDALGATPGEPTASSA